MLEPSDGLVDIDAGGLPLPGTVFTGALLPGTTFTVSVAVDPYLPFAIDELVVHRLVECRHDVVRRGVAPRTIGEIERERPAALQRNIGEGRAGQVVGGAGRAKKIDLVDAVPRIGRGAGSGRVERDGLNSTTVCAENIVIAAAAVGHIVGTEQHIAADGTTATAAASASSSWSGSETMMASVVVSGVSRNVGIVFVSGLARLPCDRLKLRDIAGSEAAKAQSKGFFEAIAGQES